MEAPSAEFSIQAWTAASEALLASARSILGESADEAIKVLAAGIPEHAVNPDGQPRIAVVGQYSAGKSTLLQALTGRTDIKVGAGIVTDKVQPYQWQGIELIDTPGIHTGVRPDHDQTTYDAIAKADLLLYLVSNELFDDTIGANFRKLAVDHARINEMLLVVNKMERSALGNTSASQKELLNDLRAMVAPFEPGTDLTVCFLDAQTALEAAVETELGDAALLRQRSGMDQFVNSLNAFVRAKGMAARYTTALYETQKILEHAVSLAANPDDEVGGLEEMLRRKRSRLLELKRAMAGHVDREKAQASRKARTQGESLAMMLDGRSSADAVNQAIEKSQQQINAWAIEHQDALEKALSVELDGVIEDFKMLAGQEWAQKLLPQLQKLIGSVRIDPGHLKTAGWVAGGAKDAGSFLLKHSFNAEKATFGGLLKFRHYSGTNAVKAVKAGGKLFGKRFKPWEAIKWGRRVANAGRVLAVVGAAVGVAVQIYEDVQQAKQEKELSEARFAIRAGCNEAAETIELHFDAVANAFTAETVTPEIAEVEAEIAELLALRTGRTELFKHASSVLDNVNRQIAVLHQHSVA